MKQTQHPESYYAPSHAEMAQDRQTAAIEARGFIVSREGRYLRVSCDACEALVINGTATHESGCPNARHECAGCSDLVPARVKYCADCA